MLYCTHTLVFLAIGKYPSFKLRTIIARYVTHISDELELNKVVCYGQIGTYVRVHVLFVTNYGKYITYFKESILPNWSHTVQLYYVKIIKYHYL